MYSSILNETVILQKFATFKPFMLKNMQIESVTVDLSKSPEQLKTRSELAFSVLMKDPTKLEQLSVMKKDSTKYV